MLLTRRGALKTHSFDDAEDGQTLGLLQNRLGDRIERRVRVVRVGEERL